MDFVGKVIGKVVESKLGGGSHSEQQPPQDYGYSSNPDYAPPPPPPSGGQDLPYPWVARWDDREGRYYYVNQETGESSWTHPAASGAPYGGGSAYAGQPYGEQPPYGQPSYGQHAYGEPPYGQPAYGYGGEAPRQEYYGEPPKKDHSMAYGAAGAAAGMLGGAVLAHEGDKICMFSLSHILSLSLVACSRRIDLRVGGPAC